MAPLGLLNKQSALHGGQSMLVLPLQSRCVCVCCSVIHNAQLTTDLHHSRNLSLSRQGQGVEVEQVVHVAGQGDVVAVLQHRSQ